MAQELSTTREVPPGAEVDYETVGFARIPYAAIFTAGRGFLTAADGLPSSAAF
jgi:hypothetical protein